MGFIIDAIRKKLNKDTAKLFLDAYHKVIKHPYTPQDGLSHGTFILSYLGYAMLTRRIGWSQRSLLGFTFMGYKAIEIDERMDIVDFVVQIIFWEQVVVEPSKVCRQHITHGELREKIAFIYDCVYEVSGMNVLDDKAKRVAEFTDLATEEVRTLGCRVY